MGWALQRWQPLFARTRGPEVIDNLAKLVGGWKGYAAAAAVGAVAAWWVQGLRLDASEVRLGAAQGRISLLESVNGQAARDVAACNAAVEQLRREADERAARAAEIQAQAEQEIGALEIEVERWRNRPPAAADTCGAISDLRHEYMQGRGR